LELEVVLFCCVYVQKFLPLHLLHVLWFMFHGIVGKTNVYDLNLDMAVTFEHCQIEVKSEGIAAHEPTSLNYYSWAGTQ